MWSCSLSDNHLKASRNANVTNKQWEISGLCSSFGIQKTTWRFADWIFPSSYGKVGSEEVTQLPTIALYNGSKSASISNFLHLRVDTSTFRKSRFSEYQTVDNVHKSSNSTCNVPSREFKIQNLLTYSESLLWRLKNASTPDIFFLSVKITLISLANTVTRTNKKYWNCRPIRLHETTINIVK